MLRAKRLLSQAITVGHDPVMVLLANETHEADQRKQTNQITRVSGLASSGIFGAMADFQTIATEVLKKDGIVPMPFIVSGTFDVPSSCPDDDLSQPIDLSGTLRPEGDSALVGDMPRRLSDTKKLSGTIRSGSFVLQPAFRP